MHATTTTIYYTRQDVCRIAGVDYSTLSYHTKIGNIPIPGIWGGAYAYSQEEFDGIVKYFSARRKWARSKPCIECENDQKKEKVTP